ncbi:MAG: efflux RND transporter permease subunit, partial [Planctomycetota bacterium]
MPSAAPPPLRVPEPAAPEPTAAPEGAENVGVVVIDLLAPSTVDRIHHNRTTKTIEFSYLMSEPLPKTREEAVAVRDAALDNPLLNGTVVSADGKAVCIYLPITHKEVSYKISRLLQEKIADLGGPEQYHITGLPVAEDTFGHQMFVQMAVSAPLAMLVIFLLMFAFFRKLVLIISPMIVALVSVVVTMGLLIGLGYTVHIMSSMIPIFIMPIAVLDAIHILSEFFDRYQATRDRRATILRVMQELFVPMLYTSLTSAAGFASLALTPIPPVQVFGVFVAFGIMTAWVLTVTFIPAYVMFIPERRLAGFGVSHGEEAPRSLLTRLLRAVGGFTYRRRKLIVTGALLVLAVAIYGISQIRINDNPTKWFVKDHPIRIADRVLNEHFAGTYQAYLAITPLVGEPPAEEAASLVTEAIQRAAAKYASKYPDGPAAGVYAEAAEIVKRAAQAAPVSARALFEAVLREARRQRDEAAADLAWDWDDLIAAVEAEQRVLLEEPLKRPDVLRYIEGLQEALVRGDGADAPVVGKSNSVVDIVKKVNKELSGEESQHRVPDTPDAVASCLLQFQNGHTPDDLYHFVNKDFDGANVWLQLKSGDNKDMERVIEQVDAYVAAHEPPVPVEHEWFGLTYINVAWQQKMVSGMLQAFMGSFVVVFILMTVLFHSALWGMLCMIPLTVTIALIYGLIGLAGKDYDMPVAVLSSLTLGLAVDFAIHFLARARDAVREVGSWDEAAVRVFGEPARAISRNAIVVAVGFLPLLAAPLVPYKTVGMFMAGILGVAAVGTLLILPALVTVLRQALFARMGVVRITCNCVACMVSSVAAVLLLALSLHGYFRLGWNTLTWLSVVLIPVVVFGCGFFTRRAECKRLATQ